MSTARKQFSEAVKRRQPQIGLGRYQQVDRAPPPANGVARPPPSLNVRTALVAVPDPLDPNARIQATVNIATDLLETEKAHGRISEQAYRVGCAIQAAYEGERNSDAPNERVDVSTNPDHGMVCALDRAQRRVALQQHIEHLVGVIGAKMLRMILVEGFTFNQYAAQVAKRPGERGTAYVAGRFRSLLEEMAEHWAATGAR
jgi:hypothetical protein